MLSWSWLATAFVAARSPRTAGLGLPFEVLPASQLAVLLGFGGAFLGRWQRRWSVGDAAW